ncbi:hypothetical protein [Glaciibacter superstes]|nr:hypothetical protein [Glaciibacter superstes]
MVALTVAVMTVSIETFQIIMWESFPVVKRNAGTDDHDYDTFQYLARAE